MAEDMTIDQVAQEYGVSRSTVERAINDGSLRYHDGVNEDRRVVTMIEAEDALHWWNTRYARRKRKARRGQVRVVVGDVVDAAGDDADDDGDADDGDGAGDAERALVPMDGALRFYADAMWRGMRMGRQSALQVTRAATAELAAQLAAERERAVRAEQRVAAAEARGQERPSWLGRVKRMLLG